MNYYSDAIVFLPLVPYISTSASEAKFHQLASRLLHVLSWSSGGYLYLLLSKIFIAKRLRLLDGKFYVKGKANSELLAVLRRKEQIWTFFKALELENFVILLNTSPVLYPLSIYSRKTKKKHCAKRKAQLNFYWLTLPTKEFSSGESSSFNSSNDRLNLQNERQSNHFFFEQRRENRITKTVNSEETTSFFQPNWDLDAEIFIFTVRVLATVPCH